MFDTGMAKLQNLQTVKNNGTSPDLAENPPRNKSSYTYSFAEDVQEHSKKFKSEAGA